MLPELAQNLKGCVALSIIVAVWTVIAATSAGSCAVDAAKTPLTALPAWAPSEQLEYGDRMCGPNVLHLFLKARNRNFSIFQLRSVLPKDARGMSLQELCDAAKASGEECEIRKANPRNAFLPDRSPEIVLLSAAHSTSGHFVLVTSMTKSAVNYVDGSSGATVQADLEAFRREWSGYYIVPVLPSEGWHVRAAFCISSSVLALLVSMLRVRTKRVL